MGGGTRKKILLPDRELEVDRIYDTDLIGLTLAEISSSEFALYGKRFRPYAKSDEVWEKRRLDDRTKFVWLASSSLEHKYFRVRRYPI